MLCRCAVHARCLKPNAESPDVPREHLPVLVGFTRATTPAQFDMYERGRTALVNGGAWPAPAAVSSGGGLPGQPPQDPPQASLLGGRVAYMCRPFETFDGLSE